MAASGSTCVISADGYADLTLLLDKTSHSASISPSDAPCQHQGRHRHLPAARGLQLCGKVRRAWPPQLQRGRPVHRLRYPAARPACRPHRHRGQRQLLPGVQHLHPRLCGRDHRRFRERHPWSEQSFRIALNGAQYYKDAENNQLFFCALSNTPLQSGDLITITNPNYEDVKLKLTIAGSTVTPDPCGRVHRSR